MARGHGGGFLGATPEAGRSHASGGRRDSDRSHSWERETPKGSGGQAGDNSMSLEPRGAKEANLRTTVLTSMIGGKAQYTPREPEGGGQFPLNASPQLPGSGKRDIKTSHFALAAVANRSTEGPAPKAATARVCAQSHSAGETDHSAVDKAPGRFDIQSATGCQPDSRSTQTTSRVMRARRSVSHRSNKAARIPAEDDVHLETAPLAAEESMYQVTLRSATERRRALIALRRAHSSRRPDDAWASS